MLNRILEPEVMDTVEDAHDYDSMDHSHVNRIFVDDLLAEIARKTSPRTNWTILDTGTGTALIPLELVGRHAIPISRLVAYDLAEEMLALGQEHVLRAGYASVIRLLHADCKHLPDPDQTFDIVMSNSIVHHIPEPREVFSEMWRVLKPGGLLFVRDLMRPATLDELDHIVSQYAAEANLHQRQLFRDSLHAALTVEEVVSLLSSLDIPVDSVRATSDRHWTVSITRK